jgi:hypothetical protein
LSLIHRVHVVVIRGHKLIDLAHDLIGHAVSNQAGEGRPERRASGNGRGVDTPRHSAPYSPAIGP